MPSPSKISQPPSPLTVLAVMLSLFYLSYLAMTTQAVIFNDSLAYESTGRMLAEEPWQNYFISGPNRELMYPLLVSIAMRISNVLGAPYLNIEIPLQVLCLILAQFLMIKVLKKFQMADGLIAAVVLFMGFSPALVNSSLILYSEIITYPMILWIVLAISDAWNNLASRTARQSVAMGIITGCSFVLITLTKASFEAITILSFLPFIILGVQAAINKNKRFCAQILIFLLSFAFAYLLPVFTVKALNKKFNGNFVVTNRAADILYTSTVHLTEAPLNKDHVLAAASNVLGPEFCNQFKLKECYRWSVPHFDKSFERAMNDAAGHGLTNEEISPSTINLIIQKITQNPAQYALFSSMEGLKLLFWEGNQTSYITYPDAVERFYTAAGLQYLLRFTVAFLSGLAMITGFFVLFKKWKGLRSSHQPDDKTSLLLWTTFLIVCYMLLMSRFYLIPRYGLAIAPLWIILIAWFIDHCLKNKKAQAS